MLRTSLTIAARIFWKEPRLLLLTILALALSFVVSFILWQHSTFELNSDAFRKNAERIFRIGLVMRWSDDQITWEETRLGINTPGVVKRIAGQYTEVEDFTRILYQSNFNRELIRDHGKQIILAVHNRAFTESKIIYADSNVFSFFNIPLIHGNPATMLSQPNAVVVSKSTALRYFGKTEVTGKSLLLNDTVPLQINGVFADLPQNTHLDFEIILNSKRIQSTYHNRLEISVGGPHCYVKLKEGVDANVFAERINSECVEILRTAMYDNPLRTLGLFLQQLREVPFSFNRLDVHHPESKYFLEVLRFASWIILLVGLVNYINLMISLTGFRLKELAVKKTVGATLGHFLRQFTLESSLIHFIAVLLAFIVLFAIEKPASVLLNFYIPPLTQIPPAAWVVMAATLIASILVSSLYPALVFFRIGTNRLFKFARVYNSENLLLKILSVFQYSTAMVMLFVSFVITHQLYFVINKGLGIRSDNSIVVDLSLANASPSAVTSFIEKLKVANIIEDYTQSASIPGDNAQTIIGLKTLGSKSINFIETNGAVDENFIRYFNLRLIAGENFQPDSSDQLILTEGATLRLGFVDPSEAIGQFLFTEKGTQKEVVGIIADYKLKPALRTDDYLFFEGNTGVVLSYANDGSAYVPPKLALRLLDGNGGIEDVRDVFRVTFPEKMFICNDLDSVINAQYDNYNFSRNQLIFFLFARCSFQLLDFMVLFP